MGKASSILCWGIFQQRRGEKLHRLARERGDQRSTNTLIKWRGFSIICICACSQAFHYFPAKTECDQKFIAGGETALLLHSHTLQVWFFALATNRRMHNIFLFCVVVMHEVSSSSCISFACQTDLLHNRMY
jgi:hypothetical protein